MDRISQQWEIPEGTDVVGADGEKVGKVVATEASYVVVEKGFFFPTDYYIPSSAIAGFDGEKVYLSVSKDEALNQGWDQQLADDVDVGAGDSQERTGGIPVTSGDTLQVPIDEEELTATKRVVEQWQEGSDRVRREEVQAQNNAGNGPAGNVGNIGGPDKPTIR